MEKLNEILKALEQGKISTDHAEQQVLDLFAVSSLLIFLDNHVNRSKELLLKDEIAKNDGMHYSILGQMTAYNEVRKYLKKINNC